MRPSCLVLGLAVAAVGSALAADAPDSLQQQHGGTYYEPPRHVDNAYLPPGPNGRVQDPGTHGLTLRLTADFPLRTGPGSVGSGVQGSNRASSPTLQALLELRPPQWPGWFAQAALYRYLQSGRQQPWEPDFTYAFGYQPWSPGSFSLVYANHTGTRSDRLNFGQGQWALGYNFALPELLEPLLLRGDGDDATCNANLLYTPRYTTAAGVEDSGKTGLRLGCRYTHPSGWFGHLSVFGWAGGAQQPWDPDYTYGVGYTHPATGITVQYANYSGNRWPGRPRGPGEGGLRGGSVSLSWQAQW